MRPRPKWPRWLGVYVMGLGTAWAGAQTVPCLRADRLVVPVGQSVTLRVGQIGGAQVRPAAWPSEVAWMFVRSAGTQDNLRDPRPKRAGGDSLAVPLRHAGVALIGLDEAPRVERAAPERFQAFVANRISGDAQSRLADKLGRPVGRKLRVRRVSSGKVLVRVAAADGADTGPSAVAVGKAGQRVELRPLADPTRVRPGGDLPVRAYVRGSKAPGVLVRATNETTGSVVTTTADASGIGNLRLPDAGVWRVAFCQVEPGGGGVDWVVYSATLMFETPGAKGVGR